MRRSLLARLCSVAVLAFAETAWARTVRLDPITVRPLAQSAPGYPSLLLQSDWNGQTTYSRLYYDLHDRFQIEPGQLAARPLFDHVGEALDRGVELAVTRAEDRLVFVERAAAPDVWVATLGGEDRWERKRPSEIIMELSRSNQVAQAGHAEAALRSLFDGLTKAPSGEAIAGGSLAAVAPPAVDWGLRQVRRHGFHVFPAGAIIEAGLQDRVIKQAREIRDRVGDARRHNSQMSFTATGDARIEYSVPEPSKLDGSGPRRVPIPLERPLGADAAGDGGIASVWSMLHQRLGHILGAELVYPDFSIRSTIFGREYTTQPHADLNSLVRILYPFVGRGPDMYWISDGVLYILSASARELSLHAGSEFQWLYGAPAAIHSSPAGDINERILGLVSLHVRKESDLHPEAKMRQQRVRDMLAAAASLF